MSIATFNTPILSSRSADDSLPLFPRITPSTVIGGLILISGGFILGVSGVRRRLIQTFISTGFLTAVSITLLIDYVMKPPVSDVIQGAYLVAVVLTGCLLGIAALLLKDFTQGLGCLLGGFCLSMWIMTIEPSGTIQDTGGKAIFMSMLSLFCWSLSFSRYTRDYALIGLTSFAGSTAFVLGIDCFSQAGLKEFWLYIWNLNPKLFPISAFSYPITKGMRVETVVIPVLCLIGVVAQSRLWRSIRDRRKARKAARDAEQRRRETVDEVRGFYMQQGRQEEKTEWEKTYDPRYESRQSLMLPSSNSSSASITIQSYNASIREFDPEGQKQPTYMHQGSWSRSRNSVMGRGYVQQMSTVNEVEVSRALSTTSDAISLDRCDTSTARSLQSSEMPLSKTQSLRSQVTMTTMSDIETPLMNELTPVLGRNQMPSPLPQELEDDPEEFRRPTVPLSDRSISETTRPVSMVGGLSVGDALEPQRLASEEATRISDEEQPVQTVELPQEPLVSTSRPPLPRVATLPTVSISAERPKPVRRSTGPHRSQVPHPLVARLSKSSQSPRSPYRSGIRSISTPAFSQELVQSPIEEDAEVNFVSPNQSRTHLHAPMSETDLRRQSALRRLSAPLPMQPQPVASQASLGMPRPQIRVSSTDNNSAHTILASPVPHRTRSTPRPSTRTSNDPRIPLSFQPAPSPADREATLAELRASIRRESAALVQSQSKLDLRRVEMMQEKQWARASLQQQQVVKDHKDVRVENAMRRTDMQDLHREAMRKMQAQASRHV